MTPENLHVCVWKVESLWLKERDLHLTSYKNMSRRMGDKGVLGKECQQNWISSQEDTTQAMVQWFTMSWQLFTMTSFQTLLCMTISQIMCSSKASEWTWIMNCVFHPPPVLDCGCTMWTKCFAPLIRKFIMSNNLMVEGQLLYWWSCRKVSRAVCDGDLAEMHMMVLWIWQISSQCAWSFSILLSCSVVSLVL